MGVYGPLWRKRGGATWGFSDPIGGTVGQRAGGARYPEATTYLPSKAWRGFPESGGFSAPNGQGSVGRNIGVNNPLRRRSVSRRIGSAPET